jgi:hypothetical protein
MQSEKKGASEIQRPAVDDILCHTAADHLKVLTPGLHLRFTSLKSTVEKPRNLHFQESG